ncbi:MAG: hypothetical protein H0W83_11455 [Planctomycetes bacterium]|nr:hypothetical protein [Planctomycetota bacterium]
MERFLTPEEVADALAGFHQVFAPDHQGFVQGRTPDRTQQVFPWDHSGLNRAAVHPELVAAAERIIGTRDIRLADSDINVRYAGEQLGDGFHVDVGNNTLGPIIPEDHSNITIALVLTDVQPGMSPTRMVPWGRPDSEAEPMTVPAGSLCIYSTFSTRHSATTFSAPTGYRATMWTIWCRADRPWEGRSFTYKGCGWQKEAALKRYVTEATPRQLEMIGFPPPGHPLWTRAYIDGMAQRYPGFETAPYVEALSFADGSAQIREHAESAMSGV